MNIPPEALARLTQFTEDIKAALDRFGSPPDIPSRCGMLIGLAWAQLRRELPADVARRVVDDTIESAEEKVREVGQG